MWASGVSLERLTYMTRRCSINFLLLLGNQQKMIYPLRVNCDK